ncbi:MAG: molybdenum cofactor guanylyltransferase [Chloroflexi bacterium]|nr:molybdenum cofactor guanylyltransferase [Chloroflexota bacterium]
MTKNGLTGVILAGGASHRMGRNKALLDLADRPMIAVIAERLRAVADEIIIAATDTQLYAPFADRSVTDVFPGVGTLGGIHAGLRAATYDLALVVGCDMPFLDPAVMAWFAQAATDIDLVVLRPGEWLEPLHAVYRKSCLPVIESAIRAGERQAFCFYDDVRTRYVDPTEIEHLDPGLRSFRNINTPKEWRTVVAEVMVEVK